MTRAPSPIPVRPVWPERTGRTSDATVRALVAHAFSFADRHTSAESYAAKLFPDDRITELITRAASAPATTTTSGWANTLAGAATLDLISTLGPVSAASELIRRSIQLSFGNNYSVFVPRVISSAGDLEFVAEAAPLPVQQLGIGGVTMTPYTCGGIYTFTSEILRRSVPDLERLTRAVLNESVGLTLDSIMLDANPASATRPAGLRNNITGLTAVAGGGDNAMLGDIKQLAAAVQGVGGLNIVFVAAPAQALTLLLRAGPDFNTRVPVLPSNALAPGSVMSIAIGALAVAADPMPRFEQSNMATLHMEADAPQPIAVPGSPNVISAPVRSLWNTDSVGVRLIMEISWGLRAPNAVAFVTSTTW